jgi:hypothetical protein
MVTLALIVGLAVVLPVAATVTTADAATNGCPASIVRIIQRDFGRAAPWAIGVAWRESRCQPGAANRRSQARGLFQMMVPLHARQFAAVGCSWRQWANAQCNAAAAAHLYREQGTRPWR